MATDCIWSSSTFMCHVQLGLMDHHLSEAYSAIGEEPVRLSMLDGIPGEYVMMSRGGLHFTYHSDKLLGVGQTVYFCPPVRMMTTRRLKGFGHDMA